MTRRRVWQVAAWLCWLVALILLMRPPELARPDGAEVRCEGRLLENALASTGNPCEEAARRRVNTLALWLLLTAPVTLGYLTSRPAPRPAE